MDSTDAPQGGGVIVNTASISAEVGFSTVAPHNSSKHAVASLTKVAALEYAADNIRVSAFAPGGVDTPMLRSAAEAFGMTYDEIARGYPIVLTCGGAVWGSAAGRRWTGANSNPNGNHSRRQVLRRRRTVCA